MAVNTLTDQTVQRRGAYQRGEFWPRRFWRCRHRDPVVHFLGPLADGDDPEAAHAIQRAIQHQREGRLAEAEFIYRDVLLQHPRDPGVLHSLGQVLHLQKQSEAAIEFLRWAIAEVPDCVEYRLDLAAALASVARYEESERELVIALQFKPDCIDGWCQLGELLEVQGKLRESNDAYRHAVRCLSSAH